MRRNVRRISRSRGRWIGGTAAVFLFLAVIVVLPSILVNRIDSLESVAILPLQPKVELETIEEPLLVPVYLSKSRRTVDVPLEQYVRGVLAAEMPVEFELEALKAQAIAARTYLVRRMQSGTVADMPPEAGDAIVTDTVQHQAYLTEEALRDRWGYFAYARNIDKLTRAVNETRGLIVTYEGQPIDATFFSTSNGFTEDSEFYWKESVPYLRSVASPWDRMYAPQFKREVSMPIRDFYTRLGLPASNAAPAMKVLDKSPSGRLLSVEIKGKTFTGRELREKLDLPSTDFTWAAKGKTIVFTAVGYGHGVGMSQWGANGMAKQGGTAEEILQHYYTGVRVEPMKVDLLKV